MFILYRWKAFRAAKKSYPVQYEQQQPGTGNTATKRLRKRQVEHFRSLFQSHFPVRSKSHARSASFCVRLRGLLVLLHAARVFDYFVQ